MSPSKIALWIIGLSIGAYVIWALVLRYGTPAQKAAVSAFFILSPIPPIP